MSDVASLDIKTLWDGLSPATAQRTTAVARRLLRAPLSMLSSFTTDRQIVRGFSGAAGAPPSVPLPYSLCHHVWTAGTPIVADKVVDHPLFAAIAPGKDSESYLGVPVQLPGGQVVGTLCVSDSVPRPWSSEDLDLLGDLAASLGSELDARLAGMRSEASARAARGDLARLLTVVDDVPGLLFERRKVGGTQVTYTFFGERKRNLPAVRELMEHGDAGPLAFIHDDDREAVRHALVRSTIEETDLDLTFRVLDVDRSLRWLRSQSMVRRDEGVCWDGHCFDVTDLVVARDGAEAERVGCERALVDVNHEIRTPLQAIVGFTQYLKTETRPDVIASHAETIQSASEAVLSIVNQTLDRAEADADAAATGHEVVDLKGLAETSLALIGPLAREKGLAKSLKIEAGVPARVALDRQKVRQALLNLLNNAAKFTDVGGVDLTIGNVAEGLRFSVADSGIGIPADKRDRLFHRFSRVETDSRPTDGKGLGLWITKDLVEGLGGRIGVDDRASGGTVFWFEVPTSPLEQVATDDASRRGETLEAVAEGAEGASGGARILLADDLDLNRKLIADMLSFDGHVVDCVADGAAAVTAAREHTYDLILMDMIMPGMDGTAATRAIRALPGPPSRVPIVALTAHSLREQLDACLAAGMNATLTKPLSLGDLTRAVEVWTRGRTEAA